MNINCPETIHVFSAIFIHINAMANLTMAQSYQQKFSDLRNFHKKALVGK
jgi:hypothetical protein